MPKSRVQEPPWWLAHVPLALFAVVGVTIVFWMLVQSHLVLAPTPRIIVLAAVSLMFAGALGSQGYARLEVKTKLGVAFVATGSVAVAFFALFVFVYFSRPDHEVAIYHVVEESGDDVGWLENDGAVDIKATKQGIAPIGYVDGNTILLVFPEQVEAAELVLRDKAGDRTVRHFVSYTDDEMRIVVPAESSR